MNVEIYIHGTTDDYDAYTTATDKDQYIQIFYGAEYNDQSLIVETKIEDSNIYCYYTYFRKNIQTYAGRPGGYIGITLRTDSFVRNIQVMYQVMDIVYSQFITGSIVSDSDNRKFIVRNLKEINKKIVDQIVNLLSQIIQTKDIIKMDESFLGNAGAALSYNPCDNRCKDLITEYKKAEKLIISPSSSLLREQQKAKEYQQKLEYIKKETEGKYVSHIKKMQADLQMLQKEKEKVSSELDNHIKQRDILKDHVCALEMELQESKQKIKILSDQANLKTELVKISEPLIRLNALLQRVGISVPSLQKVPAPIKRFDAEIERRRPEKAPSYRSSNIWKVALLLFALISILLFVVLFFQIKLYSKYNNSYVEKPKVELKTDIDPTNAIESKEEQALAVIDDYDGARIDIKGYSGKGGLQYDKEYILFVSDRYSKPIEDVDGIKWHCDGGFIDTYDRASARLKVKRDSGYVRIVCYLPNGRSIERELKIQSVAEDNSSMQASRPSFVRISKKEESVSKPLPSKNSKFKE